MYPTRHFGGHRHPIHRWHNDDYLGRFGRVFEDFAAGRPAGQSGIDFYETDEGYFLELAVPGLTAADIDVDVEGRHLTIKSVARDEEEVEGRRYWLRSLPRGSFSRSLRLPAAVDTDAVSATVQAGMLVVTMPRKAEARARRIAISEA